MCACVHVTMCMCMQIWRATARHSHCFYQPCWSVCLPPSRAHTFFFFGLGASAAGVSAFFSTAAGAAASGAGAAYNTYSNDLIQSAQMK